MLVFLMDFLLNMFYFIYYTESGCPLFKETSENG